MSVEEQNNQPNAMMPESSKLLFSANQNEYSLKKKAARAFHSTITKPGNEDARREDQSH